ncbi:ABC transporter substrate-binding protein [Planococcus shenhongbingii]|uniref:ABC transporter substrate-binding protein n=1 Tax=Planococcus shenhongbingii TaxID=3058398 RepID=UPI00261E67AE|nr:ABC transporter substrate-binding protein [Planococcus sp. N016]WKA58271.1 ABC transporter substrate-binding protein [Planococcus sp. N016]
MNLNRKSYFFIMILLLISIFFMGCSSENTASDKEAKEGTDAVKATGGTIKVAYPTQPQTLDPHATTADATRDAAKLIYEALVTLDSNYEVIPQLADSYEVSEDRKTITFKLREGVKFHNGNDMTAEDIVASMEKWGKDSAELGEHQWTVEDERTVTLTLTEPSSLIMYFLADQGKIAAIMPKDIAESAETTGAAEYIGTGPFKFIEWKQDEVIKFEKFDDYVPDTDETDGLGGKKEALVDAIDWQFVPDSSTRVNGLISGQYHFAHMLAYDSIPQVENSPGSVVDIWPYGIEGLVFNKKQGVFSDVKMRQAVNAALDMEVIMSSAFTDKEFYQLENSLFLPSQKAWYSDAGKENYNQKDMEKAKALLKEAGYKGEEVVILTSRDYEHHYNAAVATQQQLEELGITTKLDVYDWPTLLERRDDPEAYDMFFTGFSTTSTPNQYAFLDSQTAWPGWTENSEIDRLLGEIKVEEDLEKALALTAEVQTIMWEDLPIINTGHNSRVSGYSEKLQGYNQMLGPNFWNVGLNE